MGTFTKIKIIGLTKLNNAEYDNFMTRYRGLIPGGESDSPTDISTLAIANILGITVEQLAAFDADLARLIDLVNQSRISDETAKMMGVNKRRQDLVIYITSSVKQMRKSPLVPQRAAAQTVYNIVKPYVGIYKSANQQETAQIDGLLTDLAKTGISELVRTLGLTEVVSSLREANVEYATLTAQRTKNKASAAMENSAAIRLRMDVMYDDMTTVAFVQSVANPTMETASFVINLNALIDETISLYNQRVAAGKKKPEADSPVKI